MNFAGLPLPQLSSLRRFSHQTPRSTIALSPIVIPGIIKSSGFDKKHFYQ
jgi:hypothetical protein